MSERNNLNLGEYVGGFPYRVLGAFNTEQLPESMLVSFSVTNPAGDLILPPAYLYRNPAVDANFLVYTHTNTQSGAIEQTEEPILLREYHPNIYLHWYDGTPALQTHHRFIKDNNKMAPGDIVLRVGEFNAPFIVSISERVTRRDVSKAKWHRQNLIQY